MLIPIPYTDLTSHKKRPVIIISNDDYNGYSEDVIVVAVTSNLEQVKYSIPIDNSGLEEGSLKVQSMVRPDKIYTLHQGIIIKKFGKVSEDVFKQIKTAIVKIMG